MRAHFTSITLAALVACASVSLGQTATATLNGTVIDSLGAAVPKANVAVHSLDNKVHRKVIADATGHYTITGLPAATYEVDADAAGFAVTAKTGVVLTAGQTAEMTVPLRISDLNEQVTVEADASNSIAAQQATIDSRLDTRSARTEITDAYIRNFTAPTADYAEIIQNAPGTFSVNANGVGLGDAKTYFRGFADGNYDITFDGIPFEDSNSPTHHSWAFFPSPLIGGIDFDRSPGSASTVGPTPFGGSINLLSRPLSDVFNVRGGVSYGSFNTILTNVELDTGRLGANKKTLVTADFNRLTSDGFQTFNAQQREAGGIKVQYKFNDEKVLTGFSGVVLLDANTPNTKGPTRAKYQQQYNYLMQNTDSTQADYVGYNFYHIPTDFEYVGFKTPIAKGWHLDQKGYTYSYYNQQNYAIQPSAGAINLSNCVPTASKSNPLLVQPCGTDKLNSYRRYGDIATFSQVSRFGILRTGMWYEWATTSRHQVPQNPITGVDDSLPNFNEKFITTTYQPFAEYEWHPNVKLAITAGFKYAHYGFDLKQYADNGSTIGNVSALGLDAVYSKAGYNSYLPSADVNYRIRENWSVYGQFATGSVIPPSSVFDVKNVSGTCVSAATCTLITTPVTQVPSPSYAKSYQGGTVLKQRRYTLSADVFYVHFGNAYVGNTDPNNPSGQEYQPGGDTATKGFEGETNIALARGLNVYLNGTVGSAKYVSQYIASGARTYYNVNRDSWVANTPANTETYGITYSRYGADLGFFTKRIGPMWNDVSKVPTSLLYSDGTRSTSNQTINQVIPIDPFSVANVYLNYTVRGGSRFNNTKLRLSVNNLFDAENITGVTAGTASAVFNPGPTDQLSLLPGRSVTLSVVFGYGRGR